MVGPCCLVRCGSSAVWSGELWGCWPQDKFARGPAGLATSLFGPERYPPSKPPQSAPIALHTTTHHSSLLWTVRDDLHTAGA